MAVALITEGMDQGSPVDGVQPAHVGDGLFPVDVIVIRSVPVHKRPVLVPLRPGAAERGAEQERREQKRKYFFVISQVSFRQDLFAAQRMALFNRP